nr:hypothetical protein Iba_chr02cCG11040 [Ipomoea batatas]
MEQGSGGDLQLQRDDGNNEELPAATAAWWQQAGCFSHSLSAEIFHTLCSLFVVVLLLLLTGCFSHSLLLYCCCHIPRTVAASHIPLPVVVSSFHCLLLFLQFSHSSIPTLPHSSILTLPLLLLLTFHYLFLNSHTATVAASHIPLPVAVSSFHSTACCCLFLHSIPLPVAFSSFPCLLLFLHSTACLLLFLHFHCLPVVVSSFHCLLMLLFVVLLRFLHSTACCCFFIPLPACCCFFISTFHCLPVAVSSFPLPAYCSYIKEMANTTYPSSSDNSSFWDDIIVSPLRDSAQSIDLTVVENFENPPLESNEIIATPGATGTDVVAVDQGTTVVVQEDNTTTALDVATMNARVFRGRKRTRRTFCDTTTLTFEKNFEYFYLPSEQAAEEMQVSLNLIP